MRAVQPRVLQAHFGLYGVGRLMAPLFSLFSILKRSGRQTAVELLLLVPCSCMFSFSNIADEEEPPNLSIGLTTLARGFVANIDSFCRFSIILGRSSSTCTLPVRINGVSPTELAANRRYGESSFDGSASRFNDADDVDGWGEAAIVSDDNLSLAVLLLRWFFPSSCIMTSRNSC